MAILVAKKMMGGATERSFGGSWREHNVLALCEVQEPITGHKRKTWPRSELNRRMCAHTALPYSSLGKLYRGWNESLIHEVRKHYDPVMGQYLNSYDGTLPRFTPRFPCGSWSGRFVIRVSCVWVCVPILSSSFEDVSKIIAILNIVFWFLTILGQLSFCTWIIFWVVDVRVKFLRFLIYKFLKRLRKLWSTY